MSDLKPQACPFCGKADRVIVEQLQADYAVACYHCRIYGDHRPTMAEAVRVWNNRPIEEMLAKHLVNMPSYVDCLVGEGLAEEADVDAIWDTLKKAGYGNLEPSE